ncbi:bifunctional phosphopantothenoylcysteine decarboxylase/phosphopantothenate--cysteine ligase CoaBC [Pelagicoccus sp. SDUM812003]|uniref:bifunctional phosphopantothenoylcysteine decarboxylase/phosphopantothenate--cysteine ligase CoaBC n=1 Tax=Pelagicoccus sp. SDUM812003 TaxID=3041267 RepID=UPI00280C4348|nr:bifunctional phosphopantothenoylcysteine decarboxylase/phosphopantothenate--cysteine ligase CoaBC [Pelagicoccus sp. SDUM812003]MDQ8203449.1 bifunctional phosphopantothenoylcysteine decarboxylase/phosphopantothenate--cysteine ligase CoaBC [Pelagicoccus sp. SDUM812003]
MLTGKNILLIITGSIASYKSLELIRLLTKAGATVEAVLTRGGEAFITPLSVEALIGKRVHTQLWDDRSYQMNHIELSRRADLIVIAPASANIVSKLANGIADDLASSVLLARNKPVLLAPSMNVEMWENLAFQRNLKQIQADGAAYVPPQVGILACGESGIGKMAEAATIFDAVCERFKNQARLAGKTAIVTAGGTIERIDSVRYLSNFSSGKQGIAIAQSLAESGAEVQLVVGNVSTHLPSHPNITIQRVESAVNMHAAVHQALPADVFVGCAAVCDFRVSNISDKKIKKESGLELSFEENPDIAKSVGTLEPAKRPKLVIGFAAETDQLLDHAASKLASKGCDLIVANDVSDGAVFGKDQNQVHFVERETSKKLPSLSKRAVADAITNWIQERL